MNDPFKGIINCAKCGSMNDQTWTACCSCGATPLEDEMNHDPAPAPAPASVPVATSQPLRPTPHTCWRHKNGSTYTVFANANVDSTNPKYPETVVYCGANGKVWTRLLSDWHRSMTRIG